MLELLLGTAQLEGGPGNWTRGGQMVSVVMSGLCRCVSVLACVLVCVCGYVLELGDEVCVGV